MVVAGIVGTGVRAAAPRRAIGGATFGMRSERAAADEIGVGSTVAVSAVSLLAVQEAESGERQDQEARRHGEQVMDQLTALQKGLLGGDAGDLDRLARLVERPVAAADPALGGLLRAIQVRAAVELARRGH